MTPIFLTLLPNKERCHRSNPGSIPGIGWFELKPMRGNILEQLKDVKGVDCKQKYDVVQPFPKVGV